MLWKESNSVEILPTPSSYSADIEDSDKDSYTSIIDGSIIDSSIAVGMLSLSMSWDFNREEEAEKLIQKTYKNPLILDVKVPVVQGGMLRNAKYRVSKRKVECIRTEIGESTADTKWKVSFSLVQKELTEAQKQEVREANG